MVVLNLRGGAKCIIHYPENWSQDIIGSVVRREVRRWKSSMLCSELKVVK